MPRLGLYAGVFLVAMSVLLFQVALTRVFSLMMWFHLAYLVVSVALLGFGAAGSVLTVRRESERHDDPLPRLALLASSYGVAVVIAFLSVTLLRLDALAVRLDPAPFVALLLCFVMLAVPFLLGGLAIGLAITRFRAQVGRVYFVDLLGSAAGGAVSVLLLGRFGPGNTIVVAGALGLLAGACFALGTHWRTRLAHLAGLGVGAVIVVGFFGGGAGIPALSWRIPYAPDKEVKVGARDGRPERVLESATAQVEIGYEQRQPASVFGEVGRQGEEDVWARLVTQDGTAPTALFADAAEVGRFGFLDDLQSSTGYVAWQAESRSEPDVLVIGVGGGVDVMMALAHGARTVRGVEMNPAMVRAIDDIYDDYLGGLFRDPRIDLVSAEGRAFLRRDPSRYDLIQLTGVDTYAALASGAYTLSESYLYTVEAVRELYAHLEQDGFLNCSRFFLGVPRTPRETIRYANVAREALARAGVAEPWRHIAVFQGFHWGSTLVKKGELTEVECFALREFAGRQGFMGLIHDPTRPRGRRSPGYGWSRLRREEAADALPILDRFRKRSVSRLDPITFVDELTMALAEAAAGDSLAARERRHRLVAVAEPSIQGELSAALEDWWRESTQLLARARQKLAQIQDDFARLLRGSVEERAALIEEYPFDLKPATDDAPFFFNYFRFSKLAAAAAEEPTGSYLYLPSVPVGHWVLYGSLIQITALAVLLILWPLRRLPRASGARVRRLRTFTYFAALGIGYMFVEIAVMQKLVLFLGHPTYSLSIVLPTLLAGSGLGALTSSRIDAPSSRMARWLALAIGGALLLLIAALDLALDPLLELSFPLRALAAACLLLPVGFVLGFPFPLGLRRLDRTAPALVPWAWAVNGFLSVFSATFAIVVALGAGFTVVLFGAAVVYVAGILAMDWGSSELASSSGSEVVAAPETG